MFNRSVSLTAAMVLGATAPALATAQTSSRPAPAANAQPAPTRAAVIRNLDATFKAIDTNGDGTLAQAELAAAQAKTLQNRQANVRSKVEGEFTKLDTNKDGTLSKAEFMAVAPKSAAAGNGADLLAELDKNKDGKVSPDEYRAPMLGRFDRLDTNKDGTISATERQAAQAAAQPRKR